MGDDSDTHDKEAPPPPLYVLDRPIFGSEGEDEIRCRLRIRRLWPLSLGAGSIGIAAVDMGAVWVSEGSGDCRGGCSKVTCAIVAVVVMGQATRLGV